MKSLQLLFAAHPLIFILLGIAVVVDLTGVMSSLMPGTSFALGSILVIAYFLGISATIRFGIARRRVHLALACLLIFLLYLGWFVIQAAIQEGQFRPSLLFVLCLIAAFKTMRFSESHAIETDLGSGAPSVAPATDDPDK